MRTTSLFFGLSVLLLFGTMNSKSGVLDVGGSWIETGSMHIERAYHTATLLNNGMVLVAGGMRNSSFSHVGTNSCELYDPTNGIWSTVDSMHDIRFGHTATLLNDGRVLVVGGERGGQQGVVAICEVFDPATGMWNMTSSLSIPRYFHSATLLRNGKVLVAGGDRGGGRVLECELYDPSTGSWTATGSLALGRTHASSLLLPNGLVILAGGEVAPATSACELYNASDGTWRYTSPMNSERNWIENAGVLLYDGEFLVSGGSDSSGHASQTCELYNWTNETWTLTGSLDFEAWGHTATLLSSGQVLVVGESQSNLYQPNYGIWMHVTSPIFGHSVGHTSTPLPSGYALVVGGIVDQSSVLCELFIPSGPLRRDVSITDVSTSKSGCLPKPTVGHGQKMTIRITAENQGDFIETFNVTVYANSAIIGEQQVTLSPMYSRTLSYEWDTTPFTFGNYTMSAKAEEVLGESEISDNVFVDGWVLVTMPGDVDGDGDVDLYDAVRLCVCYGARVGYENFDPNCDLDDDGQVFIFDAVILGVHYGQKYP